MSSGLSRPQLIVLRCLICLRCSRELKCPKLSGSGFVLNSFQEEGSLILWALHYKRTARTENVFQVSVISGCSVSLVYLTTLSDLHNLNKIECDNDYEL